jgi:pimeloyl-ACP methyl ester carboxylesterase
VTATPLLLVHAFPLSSAMWDDVRAGLDQPLLTPDLPGFGGRPALESGPDLDAYADDLAEQLDAQGISRIVLGGLSLGGYVAMAFMRRHADRVNGLILADTKAGTDPEAGRANRERIAATVLADRAPDVLLSDVFPALLGKTTTAQQPDVVARVRSLVEASDPEGVAWAQRAMAARPDSLPSLHDVEVPALVIVGDEDVLSPVAEAQTMLDALPDARLVVVPGAGHLTAMESPDLFTAAVQEFLAEL